MTDLSFDAQTPAEDVASIANQMIADINAKAASEPAAPVDIAPRRRRRSGPDLETIDPRGPKQNVDAPDLEPQLPTRRRRGPNKPKPESQITPDQIADIVVMAHTMAESMISPAAHIKEEDAKKIGEAMVPVMNDFGVVVVGKVVHVISLLAAVVVVEGPIALKVYEDVRARALANRQGTMRVAGTPEQAAPSSNGTAASPEAVAAALGLSVGTPI